MNDIVLNNQQAKEFALAIIPDIEGYVNAHQDELEEFLRAENEPKNMKG